jgi:predicted PurR-regulated permease PerM
MPDAPRQRVVLELPWRTILKILAAAGLVWCLLQLAQTIVVVIVAVLLAVTLEPAVRWLQGRRLPRAAAVLTVSLTLLIVMAAFLWMTWSSVVAQSQEVGRSFVQLWEQWAPHMPKALRDSISSAGGDAGKRAGGYAVAIAESVSTAVGVLLLAYALAIYLLLDGRRVRAWLLAFVPPRHRRRAERTFDEGRDVVSGYMAGNLITSTIATIVTFTALSILGVPASLFLALLAGLSDFVPVVGFIASAIPAIVLGLTVSAKTALLVVVVYVGYNAVENYLLSPWAYGSRMRLSDVAVILAFAVGAELAGVIGALIALPVAALYPTIERIWLREQLPEDTVREHRELETQGERGTG